MSIPTGTYIIYNRVLSPTGNKLAITFNSTDQGATVNALSEGDPSQQWIIGPPNGDIQPLSPVADSGLCAGWGDGNSVVIVPNKGAAWIIKSGADGYTIQNGEKTRSWNIQSATMASKVDITPDNGSEKYKWILERV